MKRLFLVPVLVFMSLFHAQAAEDIAPMLRDGSFWEKPYDELKAGLFNGMWSLKTDEEKIRVKPDNGITVGDFAPKQILITCGGEKNCPEALEFSFYNKGDDMKMLEEEEFKAKLKESRALLTKVLGVKPKSIGGNARTTGVKTKKWRWKWEHGTALLEAYDTKDGDSYKSEFIRLEIKSVAKSKEKDGVVRRGGLKKNVKREENGDTWIDGIPMIDQGEKGYCVPATVARIFAYYGMEEVDEHAMASICNTGAGGSTSAHGMYTALKKIGGKFGVRIERFEAPEKPEWADMVKNYNTIAKKKGLPEVQNITLGVVRTAGVNEEVLVEAIDIKKPHMMKWFRTIKKNIDAGMPLLWVIPAHMRMIIGYNEKEKTIFYSDSWGAGYAKNKMSMNEAYMMSGARFLLRLTR